MKRVMFSVIFAAVLACCTSARGQDEIFEWLDPRLGNARQHVSYDSSFVTSRNVRGQGTEMGFTRHRLLFSTPLSQDKQHEWSLGTKLDYMKVDTAARMPTTGERFPSEWWDVGFSTSYRRRHQNDWVSSIAFRAGSASDEPFASAGETTLGATAMLRMPDAQRNAWLLFANFSTELDEVRSFPMPGVGYHWVRDEERKLQAIIGLPLMWIQYRPLERLIMSAHAIAPDNAGAKVSYYLKESFSIYGAYDWSGKQYIRHDRSDDDHRLNIREQRVRAGVKWKINDTWWVDAGGGYAFDRYFYEGRALGGHSHNRGRLDSGPFADLRVGLSF